MEEWIRAGWVEDGRMLGGKIRTMAVGMRQKSRMEKQKPTREELTKKLIRWRPNP